MTSIGRPRASASLTATLMRAAQLLELEAASLRASHTAGGRWCADEGDARADYEEMRAVAKQLRKANGYMAVNPLGGPAKALDACADSIRAGDPVDFAMANFGLAWAPSQGKGGTAGLEADIFTDNHASNVSAQTEQPRLVFVCSAGLLRSATGAKAFAARGCNTRACGTHDYALIPLSANLIAWADRLYFAHRENWVRAQETFEGDGDLLGMLQEKSQVCSVPDEYDYDDPDLHAAWIEQVVLPDPLPNRMPSQLG